MRPPFRLSPATMSSIDSKANSGPDGPVTQTIDGFRFTDCDFSTPEFPPEQTLQGNPSSGLPALASSHLIVPTAEPDRLTEVLTGRIRARAVRTMPIRRGPEARGLQPLYDNMPPEELERRRKHNVAQAHENKRQQRERNNAAAKRSRERRVQLIEDQAREIQRLREENGALSRERDYWKQHFQASSATHHSLGFPNSVGGIPVGIGSSGYDGLPHSAGSLGAGTPVDIQTAVPPQPGRSASGGTGGTSYISPGFSVSTPGAVLPDGVFAAPQSAGMATSIDNLVDLNSNADFSDFSFDMGPI